MSIQATGHVVEQRHARVLREALGKVYKMAPLELQRYIHSQLTVYAMSIRPYCNCPEKWHDRDHGEYICVDCGKKTKAEPESREVADASGQN
jgi:hypothetical protein